jgi:hypothetical protein
MKKAKILYWVFTGLFCAEKSLMVFEFVSEGPKGKFLNWYNLAFGDKDPASGLSLGAPPFKLGSKGVICCNTS